jgi:beta-glucosidase
MPIPEKLDYPVNMNIVKKYFNVTDNPAEADAALVFIESPNTGNDINQKTRRRAATGTSRIQSAV